MRASELIGRDVVDRAGRQVGVVTDLRCVLDGPRRGALPAPRVEALMISQRHTGAVLGYDRQAQQGPWLVRAVIRWLHRGLRVVPWTLVESHQPTVTLRVDVDELR